MKKAILIDEIDNVATVTSIVEPGEKLEILDTDGSVSKVITSLEALHFGHKIAIRDFPKGDNVMKYGKVIGVSSSNIKSGEWVHVHNLISSIRPEDP